MSKYEPLTAFLDSKRTEEVPMSFAEIEAVLGTALPASKRRREWWSNNPSNNVLTRAWLAAGYKTERVDMDSERLVFRRAPLIDSVPRSGANQKTGGFVERLQAKLGGTVTIPDGVDLTDPTGEVWDADQ